MVRASKGGVTASDQPSCLNDHWDLPLGCRVGRRGENDGGMSVLKCQLVAKAQR